MTAFARAFSVPLKRDGRICAVVVTWAIASPTVAGARLFVQFIDDGAAPIEVSETEGQRAINSIFSARNPAEKTFVLNTSLGPWIGGTSVIFATRYALDLPSTPANDDPPPPAMCA